MPSLLSRLAAWMDRISVFIGHALTIPLFLCLALSIYEVVMRYFFHAPTQWTFETLMVLCATAWVMSAGLVTQRKRHITITVLETVVPARVWRRLELLALVAAVAGISVLLFAAIEPTVSAVASMKRSGSAFNPPEPTYMRVLLLTGCVLYLLQLLANIVHWFEDEARSTR